MIEIRKTDVFANWFNSLRDRRAKARIQARIDRLKTGHFGDVAPVGKGARRLSENERSTAKNSFWPFFQCIFVK